MKTHPRFQAGKRGSENLRGSKRHDTHSHMCMLGVCERACVSACTSMWGLVCALGTLWGGSKNCQSWGILGCTVLGEDAEDSVDGAWFLVTPSSGVKTLNMGISCQVKVR